MRVNFNPQIWGPAAWKFIDTAMLSYPGSPSEQDKQGMRGFIRSLPYALPCEGCRNNFAAFLAANNLDAALESREKLVQYMLDAHNEVRKRNGQSIISPEQYMSFYKQLYANEPKLSAIGIVAIIGAMLALYLWVGGRLIPKRN